MAVGGPNPKLVTYVGVGIYEEVIFRLIAFAWLARVLRIALVPGIAAIPMADRSPRRPCSRWPTTSCRPTRSCRACL